MHYYNLSVSKALDKLKSNPQGISIKEAQQRLKYYGKNSLKISSVPLWRKIIEPFLDAFTLVLVVAGVISVLHGDKLDAIIIFAIIAVSAIIFYIQRFSTDKVLRNLSRHSVQQVSVVRSGQQLSIDSTGLVPGDILMLSEGDKIPSDARIISSSNLRVDESQLTGESIPIAKSSSQLKGEQQIYEQTNMLFQGSFVVSGTVTAVVSATGNNTEFGNIAELSKNREPESPIQKKINRLVTKIIGVVFAVSILAFGLALYRGMDFVESIRFVMALAVSAVPESLPIAISVILVLGMRRMAAKNALVRNMHAIETVGTITTIATDKTGTLTKNELTVQNLWSPLKNSSNLKEVLAHVINHSKTTSFDPLDIALEKYARSNKLIARGEQAYDIPFDQSMAMSASVWHYSNDYRIYIKGSPEQILKYSSLTAAGMKKALASLAELTESGHRVIGLASLETARRIEKLSSIKKEKLTFAGLVAVSDILRPEAKQAINSALKAGVTVRMITGDHVETAYQIGKQLGMIKDRNQVFDCREMEKMSDDELDKIVNQTRVFSRVVPAQKYRLLTVLKKHNITAMTGDGVNDVPALTNAHIGIAMGSGSHIAKDAGDIILLDDNFKTIIDAMREGRVIIANIRRMLFYLLSTNAGELLTILGALIIGIKMPLVPVQILWINLVTDTTMVIPLGLEPAEKGSMRQAPLKPNAPILSKTIIIRMIIMALTMAVLSLAVYIAYSRSQGHDYAQTLVFMALVVSQWANAFNARSDSESFLARFKIMNKSFYVGLLISIVVQIIAIYSPLSHALHLVSVNISDMIFVIIIGFLVPLIICELHKYYSTRKNN